MKIDVCPVCGAKPEKLEFKKATRLGLSYDREFYLSCAKCCYETNLHQSPFDALEEWNMSDDMTDPSYHLKEELRVYDHLHIFDKILMHAILFLIMSITLFILLHALIRTVW